MYSGFFHNFAFQKKHLFMIPANLTHYIETEIIPRFAYDTDRAKQQPVLSRSATFEMRRSPQNTVLRRTGNTRKWTMG